MQACWNAVRLDPKRPPAEGHVESYFFKLNDPEGCRALWVKGTLLVKPGQAPRAEAWVIAFDRTKGNRAAKLERPLPGGWTDTIRFSDRELDVRIEGIHLGERALSGAIRESSGVIRWELSYEPRQGPLVPFPFLAMYQRSFPRSKLVSPVCDARFHGWYEVDGERVEVKDWRGMQGHNWGKSHAFRYAWAHCNQFEGHDDLVFEGLTGQVRLGPAVTPPITLLCLRIRGVRYDWNRPQDWLRARATTTPRRWEFRGRSDLGILEGWLEAPMENLVGLLYENPTGPATHCLNSKLARAELWFRPTGRPALRLESKAAALEIGTTDPNHGVRMYV
ncbi:MAG: tocopherol cyclase family protein [Myxococcales bacterium]|nr:hypothetical protein [Polyangiaceae bacterium]MDW8247690.1 tocopherol cyclase family protein [Myxococcales bacterium]